jgi:hypothetical protein
MRRAAAFCLVLAIACWHCVWAEGDSWNKLRYRGGTIPAKVNPFDWNTTLTVEEDAIVLTFSPKQTVRLKPSQITLLGYGSEAQRRASEIASGGGLSDARPDRR